jgi:hypothetical protein
MTKTASKRPLNFGLRPQAVSSLISHRSQTIKARIRASGPRQSNAKNVGKMARYGDGTFIMVMSFLNVETELGAMSIRWDQVAAYFPPQQSSEKLLIAPAESPDELTQPRQLWMGQLARTDVASGDESGQADFIPPKGPSVNRPETLPVGRTIQDAGGVRLAILPDGSVLTRSANDSRDVSSSVEAMLANFIGTPCPLRR